MNDLSKAQDAILGCCLLDGYRAWDLNLEWFYDLRRRHIGETIKAMVGRGEPLGTDMLFSALADWKALESLGGAAYIGSLPEAAPTAENFTYWAKLLEAGRINRSLADASETIARLADNDSEPSDKLEAAEPAVFGIRDASPAATQTKAQVLNSIIDDLEEAERNPGKIRGLTTGIPKLDWLLGGMKPHQLIVFAGRPGDGKTSVVMQIAAHLAIDQGRPVGVFSLEMTSKQLLFRLSCTLADVDRMRAERGTMTEPEKARLPRVIGDINKRPIHVWHHSNLTTGRLRALARRYVREHNLQAIVIDYLGLLQPDTKYRSKYEATSELSWAMKTLAGELGLPVILAAQLNRESEKDGRRPRLSDLRDSGSIEQDADVVILLHHESMDPLSECELLLAKNRSGPTGKVEMVFDRAITKFVERTPRCAAA